MQTMIKWGHLNLHHMTKAQSEEKANSETRPFLHKLVKQIPSNQYGKVYPKPIESWNCLRRRKVTVIEVKFQKTYQAIKFELLQASGTLVTPHFTRGHDDFTVFFKYMNSNVMKCSIWIHDHHMNSWSWNHICIIWIQTWIHDHEEYCEIMSGFMCMNSLLVTEFMMLNLCLWNHMKSYYEFIYKFKHGFMIMKNIVKSCLDSCVWIHY